MLLSKKGENMFTIEIQRKSKDKQWATTRLRNIDSIDYFDGQIRYFNSHNELTDVTYTGKDKIIITIIPDK